MSNTRVSYKRQELLTLPKHLSSPPVLVRSYQHLSSALVLMRSVSAPEFTTGFDAFRDPYIFLFSVLCFVCLFVLVCSCLFVWLFVHPVCSVSTVASISGLFIFSCPFNTI